MGVASLQAGGAGSLPIFSEGAGTSLGELDNNPQSEAEALRQRIEELRARLYRRPGVAYEDDPELHDELDRLIARFVRLNWAGRDA